MNEFKIRINYRSGHQHTGWFNEFKVEEQDGKIVRISYSHSDDSRFVHIGIHDVESVTQLAHREKAIKK